MGNFFFISASFLPEQRLVKAILIRLCPSSPFFMFGITHPRHIRTPLGPLAIHEAGSNHDTDESRNSKYTIW